ncbi:MAG: c-type cytochrome [Nitrospirota bacterium]|nr:c-type cytochrome [Nitrospirota bacterium]MDP2382463.1 c-type cytochrome [Nitrospirota bacterium]MDP3595998.1 c-type cytochrome [Nitrospirota bacterium]
MKNSFSLKAGALLATAFGIILVSGSTGGVAFAVEALPEGFKKAELSPEPAADMIEAGKRVYFTKCVWCHGVDGAGDGPGADRLWPRPRNFNQGTFKIRRTASGELPLFDAKKPIPGQNDLFETVTHGLPGSAMPSWEGILTEEQRLQVLSFVTTQLVKDRKFTDKQSESQTVLQLDELKPIPVSEESLKKGAELIVEKKCVECHGAEGRGDGNAFNLKDDWGFSIQPADWHKCWNFRGSRQDPYNVKNIFRTFSTGVNGTPMPSFADNSTVEERWHIANFVNSLCEREADGKPLSIDPLADKPKINFVVSSGVVEGEIPADPEHELWKNRARRYVAMGGQITHKPRNFVNRIDDIWVKSLYNDKHVVFMFQWDDRTKSVAEGKLPWAPTSVNVDVKEQDPKTGEEGSIAAHQNNYTVYNDAIAMQTAVKWKELPAPIKPRYLFGSNEQFPVDIVKWEADGSLRAFEGTGWDKDFTQRDTYEENIKILHSEWKNGRWTVIIQRPLGNKKDQDYDEDTFFEMGQYIPTVFFAWDGHNGDAGRKMAVSAFYYTFLEPPTPREAYIYPVVIAFGVVLLEGWVLTRRSNKRKGKTL